MPSADFCPRLAEYHPCEGNNILDSPAGLCQDSLSDSPPGATVPPWEEPHRLISLLEIMERFDPRVLVMAIETLRIWRSFSPSVAEEPLTEENLLHGKRIMQTLRHDCEALGMKSCLLPVERAFNALSNHHPTHKQFGKICEEVSGRIIDALEAVHLMAFSLKEAAYYSDPWEGWTVVVENFPSTVTDIEEASKSFACQRATATVFHLMRVMEVGLKETAKALGIPYAPSWESYLGQIQRRIDTKWRKKGIRWKRDEPFFREVYGLLHAVKVAWRNPTMHVVKDYTPEQAEDIYGAVRGFMRHLATRLSEKT